MVYSAVAYMSMTNLKDEVVSEILIKQIWSCENGDGGFGLRPHEESHGGATFCAVASLILLG